MSDHIRMTTEGHAMRLTMARPEKKNAITAEMYFALADAFRSAASDPEVHAVMIEGGDEIFTAGNDLAGFFGSTAASVEESPAWVFLEAVAACPKPVVAAVRGGAIGIGVTMLLHMDMIYAQDGAYFHMPFTDLATVPEGAASYYLPLRFGTPIAAEFILLAEKVSARRATEMGLVNAVIEDGDVRDHAWGITLRLAAKPPKSLQKAKQLMNAQRGPMLDHMKVEFEEFGKCVRSDEMKAVVAAMMSRR